MACWLIFPQFVEFISTKIQPFCSVLHKSPWKRKENRAFFNTMEKSNNPKVDFISTKIERETLEEVVSLGHILRRQTKLPHPNYAVIRLGIALLAKELSQKQKQEEA